MIYVCVKYCRLDLILELFILPFPVRFKNPSVFQFGSTGNKIDR